MVYSMKPLPVLLLALAACEPAGKGVVALQGATLIDGSGGQPIQDAIILIRDGKIEAVSRVNEIEVPKGAEVIELAGKYVIPGLIDAHAHIVRWQAPRFLAWGVTTVRDMGAGMDSSLALKTELNLGASPGPRVFTAGTPIDADPPSYPGMTGVGTAVEAARAVDNRAIAEGGIDFIKGYTRLTLPLLRGLLREAGTYQMPVAMHLGKVDALTAARAGVASLEHMSGVVQAAVADPQPYYRAHNVFTAGWTFEEKGWASLDSARLARLARDLVATNVTLVPTLALHETFARLNEPTLAERPEMRDVPPEVVPYGIRDVRGWIQRARWTSADFAVFRRARPRQDQFVRLFARAGGVVVAGSDAGQQMLVPGSSLHDEMALLVRAGFTPMDAILAATRRPAQLLRADSLGLVAAGKAADLLVLTANPLDDIRNTRKIDFVVSAGRMFYPGTLRSGWAQ
jgi:imidazolonepropionase-like amidohydrolase